MHRLIHHLREAGLGLAASPTGGWLLKRIVRPLDHLFYKLSGGRIILMQLAMPTLMLTTTGAKSGLSRTVPLLYVTDGPRIVLVASNYGDTRHPGWYHNLRATPVCRVTAPGREGTYIAYQAEGAEREALWRRAIALYSGYTAYQGRTDGRTIPVMVLEPKP